MIEGEEGHLRLGCTTVLHLYAGMGRRRQLKALDDDVREVEKIDLERDQQALSNDDYLLRLFFYR